MTNVFPAPATETSSEENDKRRQILEGARRTFLAHGYEGASMSYIAQAAQVSKGTLYVYFTNKADLFTAVVQDYRQAHADQIYESLTPEAPLAEALRDCGLRFIELNLTPEVLAIYRVVMAESLKFPEIGRNFFAMGPGRGIARLSAFLAARVAKGELKINDTELAASQFLDLCRSSIVMRCQMQAAPSPTPKRIAHVIDEAVRLFLDGYRSRS